MGSGSGGPAGRCSWRPGAAARTTCRNRTWSVTWNSTASTPHQAAWQASAAYKVLTSTKLGTLLEDLVGQYIELSQQFTPPGSRVTAADLIGAFKLAARQGFALGVWGKDPDKFGMVFVVRGGGRPEVRRLIDFATRAEAGLGEVAEQAGRTIHRSMSEDSWWFEKDDFVLTRQPDAVIAVLDGKEPGAADHPLRTALLKGEGRVPADRDRLHRFRRPAEVPPRRCDWVSTA